MAVREVDERKIDTTINSSGSLEDGPRMDRSREFATKVTLWHQFRALFLKDLTLQSRAIGTNLCQLLTPIIFILFAGIMQVIFNHSSRAFSSINLAISGSNAYPLFPQDIGRVAVCEPEASFNGAPVPPEACRDEIFSFFDDQGLNVHFFVDFAEEFLPYNQSNKALINEIEFFLHYLDYYQNASVLPRQQVLFDLPFYYVGVSDEVNRTLKDLGSLTFEGSKKGFLGGLVPDDWYFEFSTNFTINPNWSNRSFDDNYTDEGPHISVPFLLEIESRDAMNKQLVEVIRNYNYLAHSSAQGYDQYERVYVITPLSQEQYKVVLQDVQDAIENKSDTNFTQIRPRGGIFIDWFNSTGDMELENRTLLQYTMVAQDLALYSFHDLFMPDGLTNTEVHQRNNIINMMSNALFKYLTENVSESVPIATYIMPLPSAPMHVDMVIDVTTRLRGVLFPFAASFLLPVFISSVVKDKHEKHLIMMEQNGLSRWTYWLVTYIFHFLLYCMVFLVIFIFSFIFQIRLFTQTNGLVLIISFLLWGHAEVVLGFYLSNFFSRPRTATIVGYLLVIAGVVIALQLEALQIFPDDKTPFPLYMMYPPFAFYRILFYLTNACLNMRCHGIGVLDPTNGLNLVTTSMMYLGWSTIALIFVSIYLSYVLPSEYGVRKSPFFPLIAIFKGIRRLCINTSKEHAYPIRNHELTPLPTDHEGEVEGVDEDVQAEEDILRDGLPDDVPVVMHQLQKEYPGSGGQPPHIAVHSMSLIIQRNECFGLLGPNGAGKTTLISVLTGLCEPTRGTARIAGYDISTDIHAIHRHLGVCPQFDIQNADLTAEEHLLFYARLKGVKLSAEKAVVNRALRQVNLYDARKRKSKALSGGMRRRLSVAMACIGNPDILILDKPTTGLDPASRRQVWEVIEAVKQERSVILTTDAMEEADHLCTRIGIMNFGRLRCLGTQTRLKARFGTGYQLQFYCAPGKVGEVESFVRMHVPQATHLETFADSCTYKLAKEGLVVSELFQLFDSMRDQVGILNWGLKRTTLEDVFLNIVRRSHDTRTPTVHSRCPSWLPCPCYTQGVGT